MFTTTRVFCGLKRVILSRGKGLGHGPSVIASVQPIFLRSLKSAGPEPNSNEDKPIKFSTSKASHRTWKVSSSMGIQHQRPLWKVLPIILVGTATILWCFLREETDIDAKLEKQLHEHLSGLLSDSKEDED
nr:ubiquinol-cytochrome-c reductase complex assembly factor 4 [Nothobranchius furzeri]